MTLSLLVQPVQAMPGAPSRGRVQITNVGGEPVQVSLGVAGIEPGWIRVPAPFGPIAPGESVEAELEIEVPAGHPACDLVGALSARIDGTGEVIHTDIQITVLDGSVVSAALEPQDVRGGRRGRAVLILRNRGRSPVRVDVDAAAPERDLSVRFKEGTRVVQAGQEVRVPTRLRAPRPLVGGHRRRPFVVSVRTRGTPVQLEGTFVQRAVMAPWMTKCLAVVAVVALWATVAIVGISDLSKHVNKTAQQKAINNSPPVAAPAGPSAANPATPAGGGGSSGSGSSSGSGGGGSGGGGAGGAGAGGGGATGAAGATAPSRVSGKVAASQAGGVTVTVKPTSITDAPPQTATVASAPASGPGSAPASASGMVLASATFSGPVTKLYGADLPGAGTSSQSSSSDPAVSAYSTSTSPDGFWALASVPPGYYTVTFSKPGYSDASYVIDVTGDGHAISLTSQLVPGNGSASGAVQGLAGPLGGVQLTITNGTETLTTHTPTVGAVGTWAVTGLSTPSTYLVTASDPGYSNQTTLFTLGAGGAASGLKLDMVPGEGSISGTVDSSRTGQPVGGLTVTATNGTITQTTTTVTTGAVGTYSLPDLQVPGTYAVTVSGPGYVTQTQQVVLGTAPSTDNPTVNATVTPSGADVNGVATGPGAVGLPGAGAILSNQTNVFKTLTTSSGTVGSFDFGQVPPGDYVLTVEDFGYTTESAQVSVGSGQVKTVDLSLPVTNATSLATATIQGSVDSLVTSKPIVGAAISVDGQPVSVTTDANGAYSISGVNPGTHSVTASCPSASSCQSLDLASNSLVANDFESTTVQVSVALGAVVFAPQILMPKLDQLAGVVVDGTGARVPFPNVTLTSTANGVSYTPNGNPGVSGATPAQGGFEFDNLPNGTYTMTITGPAPPAGAGNCPGVEEYKPLTTSLDLQVDTDYLLNGAPGTPNASPTLAVLPQYRVVTNVAVPGGTPTPTPNVTVEVKATTPGVVFDQICQEQTTEPVVELPVADIGDSFEATFSYKVGASTYLGPASAPFQALYNNANVDAALLVPLTPDISVTMSFPWRQPSGAVSCIVTSTATTTCPGLQSGDLPTVTLTGNVVQPGGTTAPTTFTASSDPASGVWTFSSLTLAGLAPGPVTFRVKNGAFQDFSESANTTDGGFTTQAFTLAPKLTTVQGTVSAPVVGTSIQVSPPDSSLVVSVSSDATNNIVWQQSGEPTAQAFPGAYNATFSRSGYDSTVVDNFSVPLCDSTCTVTLGVQGTGTVSPNTVTYTAGSSPVTLDAHITLSVTPSFTPIAGLAYPTVTVTNSAGTPVGSTLLSAGNTTATFPGLSATFNDYTVTVTAPSFATSTTTVTLPTQSSTTTVDDNPSLTALGYLTGLVQGLINVTPNALAGATVTATLSDPGGCAAAIPSPISVATVSDGTFRLTNTGQPGYPGLCVGAIYSVSVTPPTGYGAPASAYSVTVAAGDNAVNGGNPIQVQANQISQTFTVTDGTNPLAGVLVSGSSAVGRPVSGTTGTDGTVVLSPDPTTYTYIFQLTEYAPFHETLTYTVGESAQSATVPLSIDKNTISGKVTTPTNCGSPLAPCGLSGVTLTLLDQNGATVDTVHSGSTGSYSFPSSTSVIIPDGTYSIDASLTGWQYDSSYQPGLVTSPSLFTVKNVSMVPSPVSLAVTVTSNLLAIPLSGYTASLAPANPPSGLSLACAAGPGAPTLLATGEGTTLAASVALSGGVYSAAFHAVVPDYYTLTLQGSGLPPQADDSVVVCPGGDVAEYSPAPTSATASSASATYTTGTAAFEAMAGQITGTAAVSDNSRILPSALSVYITPHSGSTGTTDTVFVTCSNPGCSQGSFTSDLLALGASYDVTAEVPSNSGYSNSTTATVAISSTGPTALSGGPLTVAPMPVEVQVTVDDSTTGNPVNGLSLTLTDTTISGDSSLQTIYGASGLNYPIGPYTATTQTANSVGGIATFSQVVPDPSGTYTLTAALSGTSVSLASGASSVTSLPVTVSIGNTTDQTVDAYYTGSIAGTVYDAPGASDVVYLCSTSTSNCSSGNYSQKQTVSIPATGSASQTYSFATLTPGNYWINSTASGSSTSEVAVSPGTAETPASAIFIAQGSISGTVSGSGGQTVHVYLCTTSPCTSTTAGVQTDAVSIPGHSNQTGSASYSFTGLASAAAGLDYYVTSDLANSSTTTVVVVPGVGETGPTFQQPGAVNGTVYGQNGDTPTVDLCSSSPCESSPSSQAVNIGTNGRGTYSFTGLTPGTYYVESPNNYLHNSSTSGSTLQQVTVTSGQTATGAGFDEAATISGTVNGQSDTTVYLCTATPCSSTTTGAQPYSVTISGNSGTYSFSAIPPGNSYYVASTGNFLDGSSSSGPITATAGSSVTGPTFDEPGTISGTVNGASNTTVYLCTRTPCTSTTTGVQSSSVTVSAGSGTYSFPNLAPGTSYYVASPGNLLDGSSTGGPLTVRGLAVTGPTFDEPATISISVTGLPSTGGSVTVCVAASGASSCAPGDPSYSGFTSTNTSHNFSVGPGSYTVIASATGGTVAPTSQAVGPLSASGTGSASFTFT